MIRYALIAALFAAASPVRAQDLPTGVYEPYFTGWDGSLTYWLAGDIVIEDGNRYTFQNESGRYEVTPAERIIFDGGALDGAYAEIRQSSGEPAIVIPVEENEELGKEFAVSDIWAYRRK